MSSKKYIHYGHKYFDKEKYVAVHNEFCFVKPQGGLWASSVDAEFGWRDWCEREKFRSCEIENAFIFKLKDEANVVHIYSKKDLFELPRMKNEYAPSSWYCLDFEKMMIDGVDAIELHLSEEDTSCCDDWHDTLYWWLYGWDCDSIFIMNPEVVEVELE